MTTYCCVVYRIYVFADEIKLKNKRTCIFGRSALIINAWALFRGNYFTTMLFMQLINPYGLHTIRKVYGPVNSRSVRVEHNK